MKKRKLSARVLSFLLSFVLVFSTFMGDLSVAFADELEESASVSEDAGSSNEADDKASGSDKSSDESSDSSEDKEEADTEEAGDAADTDEEADVAEADADEESESEIVYQTDEEGNPVLDEEGNPIPAETEAEDAENDEDVIPEEVVEGEEITEEELAEEELPVELAAKEFKEAVTIDGIKISLFADKGVLPADAKLEVAKVSKSLEKEIKAAAEDISAEDEAVEDTFSFDINIYSEEAGGYVQPADGTVEVIFSLAEEVAADAYLTAYHVQTDSNMEEVKGLAEVAKADEGESAIDFDAEHFSVYTVVIKAFVQGDYDDTIEFRFFDDKDDRQLGSATYNPTLELKKDQYKDISEIAAEAIAADSALAGYVYKCAYTTATDFKGHFTHDGTRKLAKVHAYTQRDIGPRGIERVYLELIDENNRAFSLDEGRSVCVHLDKAPTVKVTYHDHPKADTGINIADRFFDYTVVKGSDYTVLGNNYTAQEVPGFTFKGWAYDHKDAVEKHIVNVKPGDKITVNSNITLHSVYERNPYKVTYNWKSSANNEEVNDNKYGYNETVTLGADNKFTAKANPHWNTDYKFYGIFQGWSTSKEAKQVTYAAGTQYTASSDLTLYAVYQKPYNVRFFEKEGGRQIGDTQQIEGGKKASIPAFDGKDTVNKEKTNGRWYTKVCGNIVEFTANTVINQDTDVYAAWQKYYNVNYAGEGTANIVDGNDYFNCATVTVTGAEPQKTGYNFIGWAKDGNTRNLLHKGDTFAIACSDVTLTAQFAPKQSSFKIEIYSQKGNLDTNLWNYDVATSWGAIEVNNVYTDQTVTLAQILQNSTVQGALAYNGLNDTRKFVPYTALVDNNNGTGHKTLNTTGDSFVVNADGKQVVKLFYNLVTYEVVADANGGGCGNPLWNANDYAAKNVRVDYQDQWGSKVKFTYTAKSGNFSLTTPGKMGYEFLGWKDSNNNWPWFLAPLANGVQKDVTINVADLTNKTFVAKWAVDSSNCGVYILRPEYTYPKEVTTADPSQVINYNSNCYTPSLGIVKVNEELTSSYVSYTDRNGESPVENELGSIAYNGNVKVENGKHRVEVVSGGHDFHAYVEDADWYVVKATNAAQKTGWHNDGKVNWIDDGAHTYKVTYTASGLGTIDPADAYDEVKYATVLTAETLQNVPAVTADANAYFKGWTVDGETLYEEAYQAVGTMPAADVVVTAVFEEKTPLTITVNDKHFMYDGNAHSVYNPYGTLDRTAYSVEGQKKIGDSLLIRFDGTATNVADSCTITTEVAVMRQRGLSVVDVSYEYDITVVDGNLIIDPRPIRLIAADAEKKYDGYAITVADRKGDADFMVEFAGETAEDETVKALVFDETISGVYYHVEERPYGQGENAGETWLTLAEANDNEEDAAAFGIWNDENEVTGNYDVVELVKGKAEVVGTVKILFRANSAYVKEDSYRPITVSGFTATAKELNNEIVEALSFQNISAQATAERAGDYKVSIVIKDENGEEKLLIFQNINGELIDVTEYFDPETKDGWLQIWKNHHHGSGADTTAAVLGARRDSEAIVPEDQGQVLGAHRAPKTGDQSKAILWMLVMGGSALGAAAVLARRKKEEK